MFESSLNKFLQVVSSGDGNSLAFAESPINVALDNTSSGFTAVNGLSEPPAPVWQTSAVATGNPSDPLFFAEAPILQATSAVPPATSPPHFDVLTDFAQAWDAFLAAGTQWQAPAPMADNSLSSVSAPFAPNADVSDTSVAQAYVAVSC